MYHRSYSKGIKSSERKKAVEWINQYNLHSPSKKSIRKKYKKICKKFYKSPNIHPITKQKIEQDSALQYHIQDFCLVLNSKTIQPYNRLKHKKTRVVI